MPPRLALDGAFMRRPAVAVMIAMSMVARMAVAGPDGASSGSGATGGNPSRPTIPDPKTVAEATQPAPDASIEAAPEPVADHRALSAVGLGATYITLGAWAWYAWYHNKPTLPHWKFGGDGWMGDTTYAGGADKFGHFWANLTFGRLGTDLLRKGGWGKLSSSLVASGLCLTFFFGVEVKDGFYYEFSPSDMTGNTIGSLLAVAMSNWPALDDALDVRVQWDPSIGWRRAPNANFVEDYSGETYLFAYKPRSLKAIRDADGPVHYLEFVNPVIGFGSHNYKPTPLPGDTVPRRQELFIGLTIDMQAVVDEVFRGHTSRAARYTQNVGHTIFEFANLPYTALPVVGYNHSPDEMDYTSFLK